MVENNISNIMGVTMEKIRSLIDSETIIGEPIVIHDLTIIPVSKLSFGIASGGSDLSANKQGGSVFGGGGAGATITPVVFIVVKGNEVKLLNATETASPIEKAVNAVPEVINKITEIFKKDKTEEVIIED